MYQELHLSGKVRLQSMLLAAILLGTALIFFCLVSGIQSAIWKYALHAGTLICLWYAFKAIQVSFYTKPYLVIRPDGLAVNDLPHWQGGFLLWDNIEKIETLSYMPPLNPSMIYLYMESPERYRGRQTNQEKFVDVIRCLWPFGQSYGPYFMKQTALYPVAEMDQEEFLQALSHKSGVKPTVKIIKSYGLSKKAKKTNRKIWLASIFIIFALTFYNAYKPHLPDSAATAQTLDLKALAEHGDPDAQTKLGWRYSNGVQASKDSKIAVYWWRKAAKQGWTKAEYNMGWAYAGGRGVKRNYKKAFKWFSKAAAKEFPLAQSSLGWMYEHGLGVEKDRELAISYYKKAAKKGTKSAIKALKRLKQ